MRKDIYFHFCYHFKVIVSHVPRRDNISKQITKKKKKITYVYTYNSRDKICEIMSICSQIRLKKMLKINHLK